MKYNKELILELFSREVSKTKTAMAYCKAVGIEYTESVRKSVNKIINKSEATGLVYSSTAEPTETDPELEAVSTLSALKEDGTIMTIEEYCTFYRIPIEQVKTYKLITHSSKGAYYNITSNVIKTESFKEFAKTLIEDLSRVDERPTTIKRRPIEDESYLLVVDPCDLHLNKLADAYEVGEEYNSQIAVQRAKEGVAGIIEKSKGFPIDKILFIAGNDILNIDGPKRTTTSGTSQDTDVQWFRGFLMAKQLYVDLLKELLKVADVHFVHNPSNHDWQHSFFLADIIQTYFRDCKNITFDCDLNHRKYFTYGKNLIGTTHGDGAKIADLPLLMAHEATDWGACKHRYVYTHHVHHKSSKDYMGVAVESMRSASGTDGWHHRKGYVHAPKAIEGFIHSKEHGQICRLTHIF